MDFTLYVLNPHITYLYFCSAFYVPSSRLGYITSYYTYLYSSFTHTTISTSHPNLSPAVELIY